MKKFFSLVLALVMVMGLTTAAWGALAAMPIDGSSDDADGTVNSKIVLNDDVVLTSTYEVAGTLTIDLNGHTISGTDTTALYSLIHVKNGANLTIEDSVGTGKISYAAGTENKTGVAVWVEGALTLESGTIEITGDWVIGFAVDVRPNAWGTAYTEAASFTMDGGKIVASDSGVRVTSNSSDSYPNLGVTFTMNGGTIDSAYDGIFVQNVSYDDTLTVGVVGGTVTSENTHAVRIYGNSDDKVDVEMSITGGSFTGKMTNLDQTGTGEVAISGGTFSTDVSDYVADGSRFDAATGEVTAMPATGVGKYDLYDQDGDLAEENITAEYTDSYEKKGAGNIGYWKLTVDGVTYSYYIECSRTKAEMYLTLADNTGVYKYLKHVEYVDYMATGKAYTNIGDDCGELDVGAKAKAYVLTDEDGNKTYWIADEDGDTVIMVGDELVLVSEVEGGLVPHTWVVTAYNDDEEPITAKCKECPATAKLYKTKLAAPVGATFAGQIAGYYVVVDGTTPSTDKVQSAETFDAGIAMYVGMSVLAATGSAVVLKKRED